MQKIIYFFIVCVINLVAADYYTTQQNQNKISNFFPYKTTPDLFATPQIKQKRFELNIDSVVAKDITVKTNKFRNIIKQTLDLSLLQQPIYRALRNVDTLYIHPAYLTLIRFPADLKVQSAKASFVPVNFSFSNNIIMIQPKKNFLTGNAIVTFTNKNKKNYVMNIVFKKYDKNMLLLDIEQNRYATNNGKDYLSLSYNYIYQPKIDKIKLFKKFIAFNHIKNKKDLLKYFKHNGDYYSFVIQGLPIFITRDDLFGKISIYNLSFRISNYFQRIQ